MAKRKISKKPEIWGKPPVSDKQDRRVRRFRILGNLVTFFLTIVIIAGGFMLPTLLYPYLDLYTNEVVQIADPSEYVPEGGIFENPIEVPPWSYYEDQLTKSLTPSDRDFLERSNIHRFLLATMYNHGLEKKKSDAEYHALIINSFRYLEPQSEQGSPCYVLVDLDINEDGFPDFRCAADLTGTIIDFRFTSDKWNTVMIEAPIGLPVTQEVSENPDATLGEENRGAGSGSQQAGEGISSQTGEGAAGNNNTSAAPDGTTGTTGATGSAGAGAAGAAGATGAAGAGQEGPNGQGEAVDNSPEINPSVNHPPVEDDKNKWSFAYAISREARRIGQQTLFDAFRQIEFYYETRYGYPYTLLLPIQSSETETLPEATYTPLSYNEMKGDQYYLHIYDLPTGERLILYIEPKSLKCIGFNLLLLNTSNAPNTFSN